MNRGNGRHHREIVARVARRANRTGCNRDMGIWHAATIEFNKTSMATGAVTSGRVLGIGYKKLSRRALRSCLEALERRAGRDRVLRHAHPHRIGLVAA